jgi:hypothetical protein
MNLKFTYLYRDGANYKQYNDIVFTNPFQRSVTEIDTIIKSNLIDGLWFVADDWGLSNKFFEEYTWNNEVDYNWLEYGGINETPANATTCCSIENFLGLVRKTKLP